MRNACPNTTSEQPSAREVGHFNDECLVLAMFSLWPSRMELLQGMQTWGPGWREDGSCYQIASATHKRKNPRLRGYEAMCSITPASKLTPVNCLANKAMDHANTANPWSLSQ
eukprot:364825-Amphidinium_carterae.1